MTRRRKSNIGAGKEQERKREGTKDKKGTKGTDI